MQHSRGRRASALLVGLTLAAGAAAAASGTAGATTEPPGTEPMATEGAESSEPMTSEAAGGGGEAAPTGGPTCAGESDGILQIGTVLPETGNLAFLGPPEFAAAELATQHVNEAGGVLGSDLVLSQGDSGDTSTDIANQTVDRHLAAGVDVFVGAASSSTSFTFIDKVVENCKIMFSPANTSPDFTTYPDDGLYFRTSPSDVLQGRVLGETMIADGITTAVFMALQDDYGDGLLATSTEAFASNGGEVLDAFSYDPFAASFEAEVDRIVTAAPDAVALIGFDESSQILQTMFEAGITPDNTPVYLVDGNVGNALGTNLPAGTMVGIKGTLPGVQVSTDLREQLLEVDPELIDYSYAPETYDAIVLSALAATAAGTDNPADMARALPDLTRDGTECNTYADCVELLEAGEDIAYVGPSGPTELNEENERTQATFGIYCYDENNVTDGDCEPEFRDVSL